MISLANRLPSLARRLAVLFAFLLAAPGAAFAGQYLPLSPTDVAGNPRISSAAGFPDRIDIGAYEFFSLNQRPNANAGTDQTVTAGAGCTANAVLHGSGDDPEKRS